MVTITNNTSFKCHYIIWFCKPQNDKPQGYSLSTTYRYTAASPSIRLDTCQFKRAFQNTANHIGYMTACLQDNTARYIHQSHAHTDIYLYMITYILELLADSRPTTVNYYIQ